MGQRPAKLRHHYPRFKRHHPVDHDRGVRPPRRNVEFQLARSASRRYGPLAIAPGRALRLAICQEQSRIAGRPVAAVTMGAVHIQIGPRTRLQCAAAPVGAGGRVRRPVEMALLYPCRQLVRGPLVIRECMVQVPRLWPDRRDRVAAHVAALALVGVRHTVADGLALMPDIKPRARQLKPRVACLRIPDIRPGLPASRLPYQKTRFDQPCAVRISEGLDEDRADRKLKRLLRLIARRRRRPDEAQLFRVIRKKWRGEVIGRHALHRDLGGTIGEKPVLGQPFRRFLRHQGRLIDGRRRERQQCKQERQPDH